MWCLFGICLRRDRRNTRTEKNVSEWFESKLGILQRTGIACCSVSMDWKVCALSTRDDVRDQQFFTLLAHLGTSTNPRFENKRFSQEL